MDSTEYEQQLVGAMMILGHHATCIEISAKLPEEAFSNYHLRQMYHVICSLLRKVEAIDVFSVRDGMEEQSKTYAMEVAKNCTSSGNIKVWAKRVRQSWMVREGKRKLNDAILLLDNASPHTIDEMTSQVSSIISGIAFETNDRLPRRISEILPDWIKVLEQRMEGESSELYLKVGITPLDEKYGGFDRTDLIVIAGQPGMGKMLSNETPILLDSGEWTTHGQVKIGDSLASVDGKPSCVTGVFPQGIKDIYLIEMEDGRTIESGAEHLWEIESSHFSGSKVYTTTEIMQKNSSGPLKGRMMLPSVSGEFGDWHDKDAWLIGVLLGDGGLTQSVKLTNSEEYIINRVIDSTEGLRVKSKGIEHSISGIEGNWLLDKLRSLGLMGKKSVDKFIPEKYFNADKRSRADLLIGLLETDGWVEKHGSVMFSSSSKLLADGVARLVYSLGGRASKTIKKGVFYSKNGSRVYCGDSFKISIRLNSDVKGMILSPRLKANMRQSRFKIEGVRIKSVTKAPYKKECTCIMVDHPRHLYVAGDYLVTHNTEIAIMMANYIGSQRGRGLFVSMEMSEIQVTERHIADRAGLSIGLLRNPLDLSDEQYQRVVYASGTLQEQDNYILNETLTVDAIIAHAERMVMEDGLAFLCVDYLGLIKKNKAERNDLAIGDITRRLKEFSLKMNVPTILLSQLNREAAKRSDKRPIIQDLRDSGSIEQDADVIIFPYREEVHVENSHMKGIAEIIVAKYRSGEPTTAYMSWKNGHFVNMDQQEAIQKISLAKNINDEQDNKSSRNWRG